MRLNSHKHVAALLILLTAWVNAGAAQSLVSVSPAMAADAASVCSSFQGNCLNTPQDSRNATVNSHVSLHDIPKEAGHQAHQVDSHHGADCDEQCLDCVTHCFSVGLGSRSGSKSVPVEYQSIPVEGAVLSRTYLVFRPPIPA